MLAGSFYQITDVKSLGQFPEQVQIKASVAVNESHKIFHGHFPGNPIVPGVCQIQMIIELIESVVNESIRLTESDNIKFLSMISPGKNPIIEIEILVKLITLKKFSASATISGGSLPMLKFKGKFESEV